MRLNKCSGMNQKNSDGSNPNADRCKTREIAGRAIFALSLLAVAAFFAGLFSHVLAFLAYFLNY